MKTAIEPLIKQVKDYVSQNENQLAALGIVGKVKFHTNVKTDKLKKEAQIIFTLVQGRMTRKTPSHESGETVSRKEEGLASAPGATPAQAGS